MRAAEAVTVVAWPRLTTADATPESLVGLLADQGGRIAAVSAEAGVFDSLGGRYTKTANIEALLMAWGGDEILIDRRGRPPERVEKPALTLVASIQPYALRTLVGRRLRRAGHARPGAVVAGTRPRRNPPVGGPTGAGGGQGRLPHPHVDLAVATHRRHIELTLSPGAYKLLGEYYDKTERLIACPTASTPTG